VAPTKQKAGRRAPVRKPGSAAKGDALPPFTRTIRFSASTRSISTARPEALVVWVMEGGRSPAGLASGPMERTLSAVIRSEGFKGGRGMTLVVHMGGKSPARRIILAGLGPRSVRPEEALEAIRQGAAAAAVAAAEATARSVHFLLPPAPSSEDAGVAAIVRAVGEGALLGTYRMRKYFTGDQKTAGASLRAAEALVPSAALAEAKRGAEEATLIAAATNLARDLVNEPAGALPPVKMAEYAAGLAKQAGLDCTIHDEKDLSRLGMGAFLGVAQGSHQPPRMIHLVYRPKGKAVRKIALVGKGLTFDSGGLSLKTSVGMETMKLDKGGSAAVLGAMMGIAQMAPPVEVHGLMGMTENMPGGSAIKPGDVVKTCGGKTIEILNTDAEGRLVLADVLGYVQSLGVDEVVDLATLTGACMIALGPLASGLFTEDDALAGALLEASAKAGEKLWRLPMYAEFREQLKSEIADIKNTADRFGGASTAAIFLKEFAGTKAKWAHLDIAGPAFMETNRHPYMRRGATGAGVRTLLAWIGAIGSNGKG